MSNANNSSHFVVTGKAKKRGEFGFDIHVDNDDRIWVDWMYNIQEVTVKPSQDDRLGSET